MLRIYWPPTPQHTHIDVSFPILNVRYATSKHFFSPSLSLWLCVSVDGSLVRHGPMVTIDNACTVCRQEFYKGGRIYCPPCMPVQELREACDYLLIPFNSDTVKCQNLRKFTQSACTNR